MEQLGTPTEVRSWSRQVRSQGRKVVLVPTMGYFHEGHLALMRRARDLGGPGAGVVASLFVNPAQFGPDEDLERYPRDLERDARMAREAGVDLLYAPGTQAMYPPGFQTRVQVPELAAGLCGASRPGHFDGVAVVVCKLFNQVEPDAAVFGEKDFQQLAIIRRMVMDLDLPVRIHGHPVVRESDGLAMSSRNVYLREQDRKAARSLSQALILARDMAAAGRDAAEILARARELIESSGPARIDYLEIIGSQDLAPTERVDNNARMVMAVHIGGRVRLLDNAPLLGPEPGLDRLAAG